MDHLIFYKKGVDLKENISRIRFSYTREYTLVFTSEPKSLVTYLKKYKDGILFFFSDELTKADRISISNIKNSFSKIKVCLCSHTAFAIDAWQMHVFHFLAQPIDNLGLEDAYKKFVAETGGLDQELKLKTKEGIVRISFKMINYLRASGNYTQICLRGGKVFTETKQLQNYEYFTERDLSMKRMHRSFIFNMRNIKTVGDKVVQFYATEKPLELSKALEKKIKHTLLAK